MEKELPFVSVITVNYNGRNLLPKFMNSFVELDYPSARIELIVVDNCSTDGSVKFLKEHYRKVKVIENSVNNYCRANNLAIKLAKGEFIALVNNDIVFDNDWLKELIAGISKEKKIGAVTSKVLFPDGTLQGTGHYQFPNFYWSDRGFQEQDLGQYDLPEEIKSLSHCACLYRKKCLMQTGALDEDFNMYVEDVDMSIRARKLGWKLFYIPSSRVFHKFHGSVKEDMVNFYCEKNRLLLLVKHFPKELGGGLFGRGYFTVLNDNDKLLKILPEVFSKLVKEHNAHDIGILLPGIFEEFGNILGVEKDFLIKQLYIYKNDALKKDQAISNYEQLVKLRDQEVTEKNQLISRTDQELAEKNQLISRTDQELAEKNQLISRTNQELAEKNQLISHRDQELIEKNQLIVHRDQEISDKNQLLTQRNSETDSLREAIKEKVLTITELNRQLSEKARLLKQGEAQIGELGNTIKEIYATETYRFIARPLWFLLDSVKRVRKVFKRKPRTSRGPVCLAYFSAASKTARIGGKNEYQIKVTNEKLEELRLRVRIEINSSNKLYAYFEKCFIVGGNSSLQANFTYDWEEGVFWIIDAQIFQSDEFWWRGINPIGRYCLNALIFDSNSKLIDRLIIFQRLEA